MSSSSSSPKITSLSCPSSPPELLALLHCPLCSPSALLSNPTTLPCGHSICSSHVLGPCPIPSCSWDKERPGPNISSSSNVTFHPAPIQSDDQTSVTPHSDPKIDVTITKLIALLTRAQSDLDKDTNDHFVPTLDDSSSDASGDSDDDPDEQRVLQTSTSVSALHSAPSTPESCRRPRKRKRRLSLPQPERRNESPSQELSLDPEARYQKDLLTELSCEICFMLYYQPVTTPCQHSFCSKCLQRSLDHSSLCPLCRKNLPGYAFFQEYTTNKVILSLLLKAFPEGYAERGQTLLSEERDARLDTPIFICQLSFPGMPTLLHFFEPRYRLMLRRCLESPEPTFGMVHLPRAGGQCEYGTMLEIRSVQMLSDGRSMVETWGTHRFRILERGMLDGYMVGRVERVDDFDDDLEEWAFGPAQDHPPSPTQTPSGSSPSRLPSTSALIETCHTFLSQLHSGSAPWVVERLQHTYGNPPPTSDVSAFSFYMALVLPIDDHEKAKLLPVRSARMRLGVVCRWVEVLRGNWWFSSGCVVI